MATSPEKSGERYIETVGRRKTAVARVRVFPATKNSIHVNDKTLEDYFATKELQAIALEALTKNEAGGKFRVTVHTSGGGIHGQAEAIRHGIARAIAGTALEHRGTLKKLGFLKRDPRAKERRKFGLKKARKAPKWSKR